MKHSQNEQIKSALKAGRKITAMDALAEFRCFRLASRISDLRKQGLQIVVNRRSENGKTFAEYYLTK